MSRRLLLRAPAKVNWALEVLGKRPDGYHEVRTVLQTIDLSDWVTLSPAAGLSLVLRGEPGPLAGEPPEANLAWRAAALLREKAGASGGARIELDKRVPVAAGLGGGSSDAAAVLRGLRALWDIDLPDADLAAMAAGLGSDVAFFLRGGTAFAFGRGDRLDPLPDCLSQRLVIALPEVAGSAEKTARMYGALRPKHYSGGSRAERLAERLRAGEAVRDGDLFNVFEAVLPEVDHQAAQALQRAAAFGLGRPHLCGSGPAFFFLPAEQEAAHLRRGLGDLALRVLETATLPSAEAIACRELR